MDQAWRAAADFVLNGTAPLILKEPHPLILAQKFPSVLHTSVLQKELARITEVFSYIK